MSPLQGSKLLFDVHNGRCPLLASLRPDGAQETRNLSFFEA